MKTPALMRICLRHSMRVLICYLTVCAYAQDAKPEDRPGLAQVDTSHFLPSIRVQIEQAEQEAREHPRNAQAVGAFAMNLHAYQQYDAAARAYARAHLLDPQNFAWLYLLGAVQMELGAFDGAVKSFQSALRLRADDLAANLRMAQSLAALPSWEEAGALYRRILDQHADCAQAWYGLGRVRAARGDHGGAAQSYAKACDLFPLYGVAHFALAAELRRMGKTAEAEQQLAAYSKNVTAEPPLEDPLFRRIHELNHGAQAHIQRGTQLEKEGRLDEAIREHEAALVIDPGNVQVHVNLLSLYGRTGDGARAKEHFEAATKLDPGRSDAWYDYGVLLFREQNLTEAQQAFQHALQINPSYAEAHNNLGVIHEQQGRFDQAADEFRAAIAAQPNYPLARFHLGRILVNQQKYDEAIQQLQRSLTPEDEQTTAYLYALGAAYARAGDREHARVYIQKAHDAAVARGQSKLLSSIDRDLKALDGPQ
jgi:protein O-GlcNAc transferase